MVTLNKLMPELRDYAVELLANDFSVFITERAADQVDGRCPFILYSRVVNGQELFGSVEFSRVSLEPWQHSMPIKPSRWFGSSMFIDAPGVDPLSVEYAELITREFNWNHIIGRHANWREQPVVGYVRFTRD